MHTAFSPFTSQCIYNACVAQPLELSTHAVNIHNPRVVVHAAISWVSNTYCQCLFFAAAEFFEECIEEERYAAEKLTIMKEAIHAQPQYKKSVGDFVGGNDAPASLEPMEDAAPVNGH